MTDHNTTRSNRSRKRKAAPKAEVPEFEVLEVKASPIVEPAPEPTPIPEPEDEPTPQPKVVKPWEVIRPMPPTNPNAWQRGQKWRP